MDEDWPLYLSIAEEIEERILDGRLAPGDALPSASAIEVEWDVSAQVARAALRELKAAGHTTARHGMGTRVREPGAVEVVAVTPELTPEDREVVAALAARGVVVEEIRDRVTAKQPTLRERRENRIPAGVAMLVTVREYLAAGEVVRAVPTVLRGDQAELVYPGPAIGAEFKSD